MMLARGLGLEFCLSEIWLANPSQKLNCSWEDVSCELKRICLEVATVFELWISVLEDPDGDVDNTMHFGGRGCRLPIRYLLHHLGHLLALPKGA